MKKYDVLFTVLVALALIFAVCSTYVFSLAAEFPIFVNDELSLSSTTGGASNPTLTAHKILYPCISVICIILAIWTLRAFKERSSLLLKINSYFKNISSAHIFVICSTLITVASLVFVYVHRDYIWDHQFFLFGEDIFMDFFNHITYVREEPSEVYEQTTHACFPPLAYCFYYILSCFLPEDATVKFTAHETSPYAVLLYVIYTTICVLIIFKLVNSILKKYGGFVSSWVSVAIMFSSVFITTVERGNSVLIVLILLLAAMNLRDSQKPLCRELALIFIAMAAGIKIYPAIFGLLYVAERRWKETLRLVIYGMAFFFLPFYFFGGLEGLELFIENQTAVQKDIYVSLTSISSSIRYLAESVTGNPTKWDDATSFIPPLYAAICVISFFNKRLALWEKAMLLVSVICFVPAWSGSYTAIFFAIPMVLFFRETHGDLGRGVRAVYNIICSIAFAVAFSLMVFVTIEGTPLYELRYPAMHLVTLLVVFKSLILFIDFLTGARPNLNKKTSPKGLKGENNV